MTTFVISDETPLHSAENSTENSTGTHSSGSSSRRAPSHKAALLRPFKSTRARPEELHDWTKRKRTGKERFARLSPWIVCAVGMCMVVGGAIWGWSEAPTYTYTQFWYEDFSSGVLDLDKDWNREVAFHGFGATSLEYNTNWDNNSYVKNNQLHIHPRLTPEQYNVPGVFVNLTESGECITPYTDSACYAQRNVSKGAWFNAVTSARLTTKGKHTIGFGRIEVRAKMALGDWLWNAIWMMPQDAVYGEWPASGELDLVETRGNAPGYLSGGRDTMQASIHAAPIGTTPGISRLRQDQRNPTSKIPMSDLSKEFHIYGADITPQGVHVWLDSPAYPILKFKFHSDPYTTFDLPAGYKGRSLVNPWLSSPHKSAPFDQQFYLIINVAYGGIPGYFYDNIQAPWSSNAQFYTAQRQLWEARDTIVQSWPSDESDQLPLRVDWIRFSHLDNQDYWLNKPSALTTTTKA